MMKMLLAAAAAVVLVNAAPAFACPDCKDCPNKVASSDKAEKKDDAKVGCKCAGADGKGECKCGAKCDCPHCHEAKQQKEEPKKS